MTRWRETDAVRGDDYDARWAAMAAAGQHPHGEADFVMRFSPATVLDAGCGTGRVARELARRGVTTVGVDLDPEMLATARRTAPTLEWHERDLAGLELDRRFDVVVMAGNVMIFVAPGTEGAVVSAMARHLEPGGVLIAGFQLRRGGLTASGYETLAVDAGLTTEARLATWEGAPFADGDYVVSVHRASGSM